MNLHSNTLVYFLSLIILLCISCSTLDKNKSEVDLCNENLNFKKVFFENIQNVETKVTMEQDESFHKSLKFISKYSKVSFEKMLNYARIYPFVTFESDKKIWLKWYEENKCKNIHFKDSISSD